MKSITIAIVAITVLALIGIISMSLGFNLFSLPDELKKLTYQFFLFVVLGGLVSLLYKNYSDQQEQNRERRNQLLDLHAELVETYNAVKEIKRILRAKGLKERDSGTKPGLFLLSSIYDDNMQELNRIQLKFEHYKQAACNKLLFEKLQTEEKRLLVESLTSDLKQIERYLNSIIKEYETIFRREDTQEIPIAKLPELEVFVKKRSKTISDGFYTPFKNILQNLEHAVSKI